MKFDNVDFPDSARAARVREKLLSSPRGRSYGRLISIAAWAAACQGEDIPTPFTRARVIVVAGNHAIAQRGISVFSPEATAAHVEEMRAGGGPTHTAARAANCTVRLVEDFATEPCGSIDIEDAMSQDVFDQAITLGRSIADQEADAGTDLVIPGDIGIGNTTVAATVFGTLTRTEPVLAIGPGSGIDDEVWKVKVAAVRDAMFRARTFRSDVPRVLRTISAPDFVTLTALIAQCAVRRTPVLLDGAYTTFAAYTAELLAPGTKHWLLSGQLSPEPCHAGCVQAMDLTPVLALDLATGQATGGILALPLINAAVELATEELSR